MRRVRPDELDILLPACIAMFTEEVGVSPVAADGGTLYRARVAELVQSGRSFARIEDGKVVFKAEVGAATQGRLPDPRRVGRARRGVAKGSPSPGMAAVVEACRATIAPVVSLYVNDFNEPARRAYEHVGFNTVGTFMSVLF